MTLLECYQNVIQIDKDRLIDECLSSLQKTIVRLNLDQLDSGLNVEGNKVGKYKGAAYAKRKNQMNSRLRGAGFEVEG
jgi:hypothetical protein